MLRMQEMAPFTPELPQLLGACYTRVPSFHSVTVQRLLKVLDKMAKTSMPSLVIWPKTIFFYQKHCYMYLLNECWTDPDQTAHCDIWHLQCLVSAVCSNTLDKYGNWKDVVYQKWTANNLNTALYFQSKCISIFSYFVTKSNPMVFIRRPCWGASNEQW